MNSVQKIAFQFAGTSQAFFGEVYARWDNFWLMQLEEATERIFNKLDDANHLITLDHIELELGDINEKDFEQHFIHLYEQQLEEVLIGMLQKHSSGNIQKIALTQNLSALLFHFLLHGSLSWDTPTAYKDIDRLFIEVAKTDGVGLKHFLQRYGHYTSLQQRLALQLNDETLKVGLSVLVSTEGSFIMSYVRFVQAKYQKFDAPKISQSPYRQAVWQVVYAWLLTNRSSFFNRKAFLEQTIRQLAHHYLTSYTELLALLRYTQTKDKGYSLELFQLLSALQAENDIKGQGDSSWLPLHQLLRNTDVSVGELKTENSEWKSRISNLLKNESTNHLVLYPLKEKQILKLVQLLIPQQYVFVASYAQLLEEHKDKGLLQGRTGAGFHLLKWQIIFPILLTNNGLGFNRHHFVEQVLQKVANHYNLHIVEVLRYLHLQLDKLLIDKELYAILNKLHHQYTLTTTIKKQDMAWDIHKIITALSTHDITDLDVASTWKEVLKDQQLRNQLLLQLKEFQQVQLIKILYAQESRFLLAYATTIKQQQQNGLLQGKVSGKYEHLKWQFLHDVLYETDKQLFNQKHVVTRVLKKIAAHYNLTVKELIVYFYRDTQNRGFELPYQLIKIITELYQEYAGGTALGAPSITLSVSDVKVQETNSYQLLERHLGNQPNIGNLLTALAGQVDYVAYLEPVLQVYASLHHFIELHYKIRVDHRKILVLLLRLGINYTQWSRVELLFKTLTILFDQLTEQKQKEELSQQLMHMTAVSPFLKSATAFKEELLGTVDIPLNAQPDDNEQEHTILAFVNNAGLVLISPFLPRLFQLLHLTENGKFKDMDAYIKAIYLMQYAVFGTTSFAEHELQLNKLLTGFSSSSPIPRHYQLSEHEKETVEQMLNGAVQHWNKVKTIAGLREGFLQREGKLEEKEEEFELILQEKAYDMLLDSIPWSFKTIKFSWMPKAIQVRWR